MEKRYCDACAAEIPRDNRQTPVMTITYPYILVPHELCASCAEPFVALMKERGMIDAETSERGTQNT